MKKVRCNRCGHKWTPFVEKPKQCPSCKSHYWNTPRTRKAKRMPK